MSRSIGWGAAVCLAGLLSAAAVAEIGGRVETIDGRQLAGKIHWGEGDRFWLDRWDASRPDPPASDQPYRFELFGIRLFGLDREAPRRLSIPYAQIASIERLSDRSAAIVLRGGQRLVAGPGPDLLPGTTVTVVGPDRQESLGWSAIAAVRFDAPSADEAASPRLYGRVESSHGTFSGWIMWDHDERLKEQLLDGFDPAGDKRSIAFGRIREVVPSGPDASRVELLDGSRLDLHGSNDVGSGHRGLWIERADRLVTIPWREVRRVSFDHDAGLDWSTVPGHELLGLVCTGDGRALSGRLVWDRDEQFDWETLEGHDDAGFDVEIRISSIRELERVGGQGSLLTLTDGSALQLRRGNDVGADNRGLYVTPEEGERELVTWYEIQRVFFAATEPELARLREEAACGHR